MVAHGEYGIAIEDLAEHMYERDVELGAADIERLLQLALELRLRDERWSFVRRLQRLDT